MIMRKYPNFEVEGERVRTFTVFLVQKAYIPETIRAKNIQVTQTTVLCHPHPLTFDQNEIPYHRAFSVQVCPPIITLFVSATLSLLYALIQMMIPN
jgi:hypothetical protein